jgi:hypothetical protein
MCKDEYQHGGFGWRCASTRLAWRNVIIWNAVHSLFNIIPLNYVFEASQLSVKMVYSYNTDSKRWPNLMPIPSTQTPCNATVQLKQGQHDRTEDALSKCHPSSYVLAPIYHLIFPIQSTSSPPLHEAHTTVSTIDCRPIHTLLTFQINRRGSDRTSASEADGPQLSPSTSPHAQSIHYGSAACRDSPPE